MCVRTARFHKLIVVVLLELVGIAPIRAQTVVETPAAPISGDMSVQDMKAEIGKLRGQLSDVITPNLVTDETTRTALAPKILPAVKEIISLQKRIHSSDAREFGSTSLEQILAALMGDQQTLADLRIEAQNADKKIAVSGKATLMVVEYWKNANNPIVQNKVLDNAGILAAADPDNSNLADALHSMYQIGAANREVRDRAGEILADKMTGSRAQSAKFEIEGKKELRALENQPMVITGKALDGTDFSTGQWKGKVILVDFWAVWCGPCVAGLPRIEKAYEDFHTKGLEVLGISNDFDPETLRSFLRKNPRMQWPQLFVADAANQKQWNPITRNFGIGSIPKMFLIDKKGVCRNVEPTDHLEDEILKLLRE
jgi:thiol-disulfide isomerase/thioredoxin